MDENHWLAVSTWPRLCTDDVNIVGLQIIHGLMYIANLVSPYTTHCQQQTGHFHNPHMGLKLKPPKEAKNYVIQVNVTSLLECPHLKLN